MKDFFTGMNFPRAVILLSFIASGALGWFNQTLVERLDELTEQEMTTGPKMVTSIQQNSIKLSQLQKQQGDDKLSGQDNPTNYAREIAQNDNVRLGQVNLQPQSPDNLGNGIVDKKYAIKPVSKDKGWSKQNLGNFLYMLESESQQIRVTRVKLSSPTSRKVKPHEFPADSWTYDIEITSRQRE